MASQLLLDFYSWPLKPGAICYIGESGGDATVVEVCSLLTVALQLANSPRVREAEGGALLCKIIFDRCLCKLCNILCKIV